MYNWKESYNVLGTEYEFNAKPVPNTGLPIEEWGECDNKALTMTIYTVGQRVHDIDSFLHEILEAFLSMGLDLGDNEEQAHRRVYQLARMLAKVMDDNDLIKI